MQNNVICAMQSQKVTFDEIELQYSEEHKMYFYPMPEDSPVRLAYDQRERVFLPIPSDTKTAVQHWQQKREEAAKEFVDWLISLRYTRPPTRPVRLCRVGPGRRAASLYHRVRLARG